MKPHPKLRKTIKWGGAVVTVLLVVVWVGSGRWNAVWALNSWDSVRIADGFIQVVRLPHTQEWHYPGFSFYRPVPGFSGGFAWWFGWSTQDPSWPRWMIADETVTSRGWGARLLLWPVVLAGLLSAILVWRHDVIASRRDRALACNLCPNCNYDRTGLVGGKDAKCPECGSIAP